MAWVSFESVKLVCIVELKPMNEKQLVQIWSLSLCALLDVEVSETRWPTGSEYQFHRISRSSSSSPLGCFLLCSIAVQLYARRVLHWLNTWNFFVEAVGEACWSPQPTSTTCCSIAHSLSMLIFFKSENEWRWNEIKIKIDFLTWFESWDETVSFFGRFTEEESDV